MTSVYLKILSLNRLLNSLNSYRDSLKVLLKNTQLYVKEGKKPEIDLLKVRYSLEDASSKIIEVRESIKRLKSVLISYVGVEDLDLNSFEEIHPFPEINIKNISISDLKKIKILKEREKIAEKKVEIERGKYLPQIYFTGSFQRNAGAGEYKDLWQVGLRIEYILFDFGVRKHSYIKAVLEREKIKNEIKKRKLEILSRIQEAVSKINTARAKIKRAQQKLTYARAIEEAEKVKYEEGVSDLYNYLYAKSQKIIAQSELIQSIYDKYTGMAYLRFLMEAYDENN
ncbi:MAG: TolC family protein [Persephonella sp.]|nr:TolC family protein [Persephonella sp.]